MSELDFEVARRRSPEIIDLCIDSAEENEVENIGANTVQSSAEISSDLEEGEIKEPKNEACRHFQRGRCWLGKNCNFLHVGINSYKMFDSQNFQFNTQNFQPVIVYQPILIDQSTQGPSDAWDRGLKEARKLLLNAKLKKESDLDFEEKQLYQGLDEIIIDKKDLYISNRLGKRKETSNNSRLETADRGSNTFKTITKELPCLQKHGKRKLRRRNSRSNSLSPVSFRHRRSRSPGLSSSLSCSTCKALCNGGHESENDIRKTKSKLERVFSRTFGTPDTLKSRKRTSRYAHLHRRSLSKPSSIKRLLHQSYSKSPSPFKKKYSNNRPEKYVPRKPLRKNTALRTPERQIKCSSSYSKKVRSGSPFFKLQNHAHDLESCSSDMTISSIKCTSVSTSRISSEEKESISPVIVSKRKSNSEHNHEHINSYTQDINKWLDTIPNITTKGSESKSKISMKVVDKKKEKNSKPVEKDKTHAAKPNRKLSSSSSTTDKELSADELELLRYIPNKNRKKLTQKEKSRNNVKVAIPTPNTPVKQLSSKKGCGTNKENHSTTTNTKYPPPKIVYDYGSDTENPPSKLIHDYESDRHSSSQKSVGLKRTSPTPKTLVEHLPQKNVLDHETNGETQFPKESNNIEKVKEDVSEKSEDTMQAKLPSTKKIDDADDIPKQLDENRLEHKNDVPHTNKSKRRRSSSSSVERPLSKDELELLKYVSIRNPLVSKEIHKQTRKNSSLLDAEKDKQKTMSNNDDVKNSPKHKSAGGQKKEETTKMSRREQLIQQLEAVELAIAKKKKQAELEIAKLRKKKLSLK